MPWLVETYDPSKVRVCRYSSLTPPWTIEMARRDAPDIYHTLALASTKREAVQYAEVLAVEMALS
jgi:hypothetical protein